MDQVSREESKDSEVTPNNVTREISNIPEIPNEGTFWLFFSVARDLFYCFFPLFFSLSLFSFTLDDDSSQVPLPIKPIVASNRETGISRAGNLLLQGWTMLAIHCPICHTPLFSKGGEMRCPSCDLPVKYESQDTKTNGIH